MTTHVGNERSSARQEAAGVGERSGCAGRPWREPGLTGLGDQLGRVEGRGQHFSWLQDANYPNLLGWRHFPGCGIVSTKPGKVLDKPGKWLLVESQVSGLGNFMGGGTWTLELVWWCRAVRHRASGMMWNTQDGDILQTGGRELRVGDSGERWSSRHGLRRDITTYIEGQAH